MSFYQEYLVCMGDERLKIERSNLLKCLEIAQRAGYSLDSERTTWKLQDVRREMVKRGME